MAQINLPSVAPLPSPTPMKADIDTFASRRDALLIALQTLNSELDALIPELNTFIGPLDGAEPAPVYDNLTEYTFPNIVTASNGYQYRCLSLTGVTGINPITSPLWRIQTYPDISNSVHNKSINIDISTMDTTFILDSSEYRYFTLSNFNKSVAIQFLNLDAGKSVLFCVMNPGLNTVEIQVPDYLYFPEGDSDILMDPVGATLISVTHVGVNLYLLDYKTGYLSI